MLRSMYSAVSGLRGHQTMLDVIGNNISNVNTASFKSSRVIFSDMYYQTLGAAATPTAELGGSNPKQIGYGSQAARIDVITSRSSYQMTSRPLDAYISGEGYFTVQQNLTAGSPREYTRLGAFTFETYSPTAGATTGLTGRLMDSKGNFVVGWSSDAGTPTVPPNLPAANPATAQPIEIPNFEKYTNVTIAPDGTITGISKDFPTPVTLARIAVAVFQNPDGLEQTGSSHYSQSNSSGTADIRTPGADCGTLVSGGLETSNVDLSKEFSDMIVAQRGFQANARVITTSDQVLEELVNIKR
ncbi:MAG: flagellar hook-basal body complex protein [Christensenellaceae bacterium]|nr:flagellar hook-basal body complex protein [Christensenellaceae bacterium]MEA5064522.1 flagellar hook-basal body complex protein [Eubacteriales bacterium]MEA5068557.1 flagellar hook-basal body complex protein [Christensenellaceae bacterium]